MFSARKRIYHSCVSCKGENGAFYLVFHSIRLSKPVSFQLTETYFVLMGGSVVGGGSVGGGSVGGESVGSGVASMHTTACPNHQENNDSCHHLKTQRY